MIYFKNTELAKKYHVSLGTVRNWIKAAAEGQLELTLHQQDDRTYIANTDSNIAAIEQLVSDNKKYRNSKSAKIVAPQAEFYRLYNQAQIYDIVTNLEMYHEIPRQYNYFGGGASNWNRYMQRFVSEDGATQPTMTATLFERNRSYFDDLLAKYKRVNVVDIGAGNAMPVRGLLAHLLAQKKLGRYIALDISTEMIKIARTNIEKWFNDQVNFEGYESDINYERFGNLLAEESLSAGAEDTVNLVLFLGGTPGNLRNPDGAFRIIHDSMRPNDLLVYTGKLDTEASRRYFDWNVEPSTTRLAPNHRFILDLLNIDPSFYDIEMGFDERNRQRFVRVRLKVSLAIRFEFDAGERVLEFSKGETILLLRAWGVTAYDVWRVFDRNDFYTLHSTQTEDRQYILTVSRVKAE